MFRTERPLRLVQRYAGDIASFMQFFLMNFLNECAFVLCAAITQRDSRFRAVLPRMKVRCFRMIYKLLSSSFAGLTSSVRVVINTNATAAIVTTAT
jgi:hypothetical protein